MNEYTKTIEAVKSLLSTSEPDSYSEVLTHLWEGWLTNPENESADCGQRSEKLYHYNALKTFLNQVGGIQLRE